MVLANIYFSRFSTMTTGDPSKALRRIRIKGVSAEWVTTRIHAIPESY